MCMWMCRVVCCACVLKWLCVCVESVCGVCAESVCGIGVWCFSVVVYCSVCGVCCVCSVVCWVVSVVCGVRRVWCVGCVWRGLARGKHPVCRFKTSPCAGSRRLRVYRQNARMCSTCARFAGTHAGLFETTHGDVLNLHTEGISLSLPSPSLFLSSFLLSLFLRSLPSYFSPSHSLLSSFSLFSLSNDDNDHSSSWHSLCNTKALTCLSVSVRGLRSIPCLANMFASCRKQLSWYNCRSLVPLGMKWACICAGNKCCVWLCVGGVWLC